MLGIILAAGKGGRMGGPKARLLVGVADGASTLAKIHAERLRDAGASRVVVVLRPEDMRLDLGPGTAVESTEPEQSGSLSRALDALNPSSDTIVLVTPVDALPAKVETIRSLASVVRDPIEAAVPTYESDRGHPIAARASVLLAGRGVPLRDVLHALDSRRAFVAVDDPAVTTDLDTPDAVVRALGGPPRFLAGPR